MQFQKVCNRRILYCLLATNYLPSIELLQTVHEVSQLLLIGAVMFMSGEKRYTEVWVTKVIASGFCFVFF